MRSIKNMQNFLLNYRFVLSNMEKKKALTNPNLPLEEVDRIRECKTCLLRANERVPSTNHQQDSPAEGKIRKAGH